jgi:hypothetical protein
MGCCGETSACLACNPRRPFEGVAYPARRVFFRFGCAAFSDVLERALRFSAEGLPLASTLRRSASIRLTTFVGLAFFGPLDWLAFLLPFSSRCNLAYRIINPNVLPWRTSRLAALRGLSLDARPHKPAHELEHDCGDRTK